MYYTTFVINVHDGNPFWEFGDVKTGDKENESQ
jgi:hypothetical protein